MAKDGWYRAKELDSFQKAGLNRGLLYKMMRRTVADLEKDPRYEMENQK